MAIERIDKKNLPAGFWEKDKYIFYKWDTHFNDSRDYRWERTDETPDQILIQILRKEGSYGYEVNNLTDIEKEAEREARKDLTDGFSWSEKNLFVAGYINCYRKYVSGDKRK